MKRVGIFSGTVYSQEDYDNDRIKECCICVSPSASDQEAAIEREKEYAQTQKAMNCSRCMACQVARSQNMD